MGRSTLGPLEHHEAFRKANSYEAGAATRARMSRQLSPLSPLEISLNFFGATKNETLWRDFLMRETFNHSFDTTLAQQRAGGVGLGCSATGGTQRG